MQHTPVRVFHIISHFDLGGAEQVAANIAKSSTGGVEYHMIEVMRGHTPFTRSLIDELQASGIRLHRSFMPDVRFHFLFERLGALCFPFWFLFLYLKWRPDVLHCHTETADMAVCAFARLFPWLRKYKIVRTVHNTMLWTGVKRLGDHIERFMQRNGCNVAISPSVKDAYGQNYGTFPPVIMNGVEPVEQRRYPHLHPDRLNILFAGRLEPQKGIESLLETIRRMKGDGRFFFHLIGDGTLRQEVERVVDDADNAVLVPPVFGLPAFMGSFDALFMPSEFEGLELLAVEAAMAGLPVVANRCSGLSDALPSDWPFWVTGNDVSAYVHIFRKTLPVADRSALTAWAREYVMKRFSVRNMQLEYEKIYFQVKESSF